MTLEPAGKNGEEKPDLKRMPASKRSKLLERLGEVWASLFGLRRFRELLGLAVKFLPQFLGLL